MSPLALPPPRFFYRGSEHVVVLPTHTHWGKALFHIIARAPLEKWLPFSRGEIASLPLDEITWTQLAEEGWTEEAGPE